VTTESTKLFIADALTESTVSTQSKIQPCSDQHVPCWVSTTGLAKGRVLEFSIGICQVDSVEQIEGIQAEFKVDPFRDACPLLDREVRICIPWPSKAIRRFVPLRSKRGKSEVPAWQCAPRAYRKDAMTSFEIGTIVFLCVARHAREVSVISVPVVIAGGRQIL